VAESERASEWGWASDSELEWAWVRDSVRAQVPGLELWVAALLLRLSLRELRTRQTLMPRR
jgi:hypothetical protein